VSAAVSGLFLPFFDCRKKGKPLRLEQYQLIFLPYQAGYSFFFKKEYKNFIARGDCSAPEMDLLLQASPFSKAAITQYPLLSLTFNSSKPCFDWWMEL